MLRSALVLTALTVYGLPAVAGPPVSERNRTVDDVVQAFDSLTHHGEWMGFHHGAGAPVRENLPAAAWDGFCTGRGNHIQGIARSPRIGVPYFYVCSAGSFEDSESETGPSDANIMVVKMYSRDEDGERLRSNRLKRGYETSCTEPPSINDIVVKNIMSPNYRHPGGMQMVGDILAVPLEGPRKDLNFCDGGDRDGEDCSPHDGCPGGICELLGSCVGGSNAGAECDADDDCPGGTCPAVALCNGGDGDGLPCTFNDGCPGGGTCVFKKFCDGGDNAGSECNDDEDCPEYGVCRNLPGGRILFFDASNPANPTLIHTINVYGGDLDESTFCNGGEDHALPCATDDECNGACRETQQACWGDEDCPDGTPCDSPPPGTCDVMAEAGFIGITQVSDGHFLLLHGMKAGKWIGFWRSNRTSFFEEGFAFEFHDWWNYENLQGAPAGHEDDDDWKWPIGTTSHQSLSLVNQSDGRLFLIGGRNENVGAPIMPGDDFLVLYEIEGFEDGNQITVTQLEAPRTVSFINDSSIPPLYYPLDPWCGTCAETENTNADLLAGAATHITPSGELLVYAVSHYSDGPEGLGGYPTVRMAELRHIHVVRDDSPTYDPTLEMGGPYRVQEGRSIVLDGARGTPAAAAPWAQVFEHANFEGQSVMFDYVDRIKDDYDDFAELDGQLWIDVCVDETAVADVTAAGKEVDEASRNLTAEDFIDYACIGWWRDGICWSKLPYDGERGTVLRQCFIDSAGLVPGIPIGSNCWVRPPTPAVKGHKDCSFGCPCRPALPNESKNCTLIPAFGGERGHWKNICYVDPIGAVRGVWVNNVCYAVPPVPGIRGVVGAIPDFNATAWSFFGKLGVLTYKIGILVSSIDECGRFADVLGPPPPLPPLLDVLDPSHYSGFDINNLPEFAENFPEFLADLREAITRLSEYVNLLDVYVDELMESLKGFNNRASSVRWYAPPGVDVALFAKADYEGAHLTLAGNGTVREWGDLHSISIGVPGSGTASAGDFPRSMKFVGEFTSPAIEEYSWSIVSADPPNPFVLHNAATRTATLDASGADGPGTVIVDLVITDSEGGVAEATTSAEVFNVAPTIESMGTNQTVKEGGLVALAPVVFGDAGVYDTHNARIDWGDGSPIENGMVTQYPEGGGEVHGGHEYGDNGDFTVTVTVTDDDGASAAGTFKVKVVNVVPSLGLEEDGAINFRDAMAFMGRVGIGQAHQFSASDPGSDDLGFAWTVTNKRTGDPVESGASMHFNDGHGPDPYPSGPGVFPFAADDTAVMTFSIPGVYVLGVGVADDDGGAVGADRAKLVSGDTTRPLTLGQWRHQFAGNGKHSVINPGEDDPTLLGLLDYVNFASSYFSEQCAAGSIAEATAILQLGEPDQAGVSETKRGRARDRTGRTSSSANMRGLLAQRVFVAWLNVAAGTLDLQQVLPDGATVLETLYVAEEMLVEPSISHREYVLILQQMNAVNKHGRP